MYVNKHAMKSLMNNHTEVYGGLSPEQRELLEVLKEKDLPTYIHSQQVAGYAALLAEAVHFPQAELKHLITGAWLHDIGKIMVTAGVLKKTSALTEDEYASMKRHVTYGLDMLGSMRLPQVTTNCIAYHHERWDGQGYPSGIPGTGTPLEGRILQIADAFSAMMMYRPYRESKSLEQALIELKHHAGKQFDPTLVSVFVNAVSRLNKE
ncbi:HD-GYP domain-containing protein [Paenibacillus sp. P25]|nr:HD-GYP domain-containing protein [Paenibacillus sp. P25]